MHFCSRRTITGRQITFAIRQITHDINLLLTKTTAVRPSQEVAVTSHCSEMNIKQDDSLDFAEQNINIFSANPNHTPRLLTNM